MSSQTKTTEVPWTGEVLVRLTFNELKYLSDTINEDIDKVCQKRNTRVWTLKKDPTSVKPEADKEFIELSNKMSKLVDLLTKIKGVM